MTNVAETTVAQSQDYRDGYDDGADEGWQRGHEDGYAEGLAYSAEDLEDYKADVLHIIRQAFTIHGPADERHCEWTRTMAEPWASLAEVLT